MDTEFSMLNTNTNTSNVGQISDHIVSLTFYITYAFLITTSTITFIEAMRNNDSKIRHILNIETCISVVATFFYSKFLKEIEVSEKNGEPIDYKDIIINRYTDWMITTPLMLLVLCLTFVYNSKSTLNFLTFCNVLILNFAMILTGFVGETGMVDNLALTNSIGFIFFAAMYGYMYFKFLYKKYNFDNMMIFTSFFILWSFYGVFYMMEDQARNVGYNILDLLSKCFVGIFLWAYFSKVFVI